MKRLRDWIANWCDIIEASMRCPITRISIDYQGNDISGYIIQHSYDEDAEFFINIDGYRYETVEKAKSAIDVWRKKWIEGNYKVSQKERNKYIQYP